MVSSIKSCAHLHYAGCSTFTEETKPGPLPIRELQATILLQNSRKACGKATCSNTEIAAFDNMDHHILIYRLNHQVGISWTAGGFLLFYGSESVRHCSFALCWALGPILFSTFLQT